ncbi:presqualene diphosphate synthase HpnD [Telmatospirillum sp.]|uniref:presqualene diphosphate synthase HpnD n=1 Tax=Telmatospirillum sp. TaxID=2079197 RepID=UPI00284B0D1B|nr:presqualene diphosphate synthase HpnD [Telmatospirillum sp.]MDR3439301.1 presqualene diphosphate synthase HpnD [Telmatospirillum sp.]
MSSSALQTTPDDKALATLVTERVRSSGSSFYWAMRMMQPHRRLAMYAIYAFCREVDDIVDEAGETEDKRRRLALWRDDIDALYAGKRPQQRLAQALARPIADFALAADDFIAVVDGCEMDTGAGVVRPDMATLELYCDRVACAVGRLSVRIFGEFTDRCLDVANHQGRALQLTNILRDVHEDAKIGRLYLPDELLTRHGIADRDPLTVAYHPRIALVCRDLGEIARRHFADTETAMADCSRRAMRPASVMMAIYREIFDRLEALQWQPPDDLHVPKARKIWCVLRHGLF